MPCPCHACGPPFGEGQIALIERIANPFDNPRTRTGTPQEARLEYFPLFLHLRGAPVLLVGGGEVALRKARLLLAAGAALRVVAPEVVPALAALVADRGLSWAPRGYAPEDLTDSVPRLVVVATNDAVLNERVAADAARQGVLANVVDNPELSSAIVPAIIDRSPVLVAFSTGGAAPVLATEWRARIETLLPPRLGALAAFCRRYRSLVKQKFAEEAARRRFWLEILRGETGAAVLAGREAEADAYLQAALATQAVGVSPRCTLIALASDDPDLLPLRVLRQLFAHDALVVPSHYAPAICALGRRDATRAEVTADAGAPERWLAALAELPPGLREVTCLGAAPWPAREALAALLRERGFLTTLWPEP